MGVGEQEPEQKRRGARQEPTGEKVLHVLADGDRATYTDGRTERGDGGTESATTKVSADERVAGQCRNKRCGGK